jgi:hypothetical protein
LDFLLVENKTYGSYIKAFQVCKRLYTYPKDFYNNLEKKNSGLDLDSGNEEPQETKNKSPLADFEVFARQRPGVDFIARRDILDGLGSQEIDCSYDWSAYIGRYNKIYLEV